MSLLGEHRGAAVRDLAQVFGQGTATGLSDGQLLRRFAAARDEGAFSALVFRHGPMVLGVCRRVLGTLPDGDDAFQATFLVLLRRANSLQDADSLGPWLYGVAWRVASRARAGRARRRLEEGKAAATRTERAETDFPADRRELHAIIDEEINRLPEKYRRPLVLCYLEGLTQEAAARELRWKAGVLRGRLDRARLRLRHRLVRRGLAPSATLALAEWLGPPAEAAVTPALLDATVGIVCRDLTVGRLSGTAVATSAVTLAGAVLRRQILARTILIATLLAGGTFTLAVLGKPGRVAKPLSSAQAPAPAAPLHAARIAPTGRSIDFRVVHQSTGKPLPGVRLIVVVEATEIVDKTTDETGALTFDYPSPRPRRMQVRAKKEGFTPMIVWISDPAHEEEFPATFTLAMVPAAPICGLVKDEEGRPVFGAKVSPRLAGFLGGDPDRASFRIGDALTDAGGHWTCLDMPSGVDRARLVGIRIRHPDFQSLEIHGDEMNEAIGPEGVVVLERGIAISGRVVDREGHPVHGARIGAGRDWFGSDPPVVETDGDGRFSLKHLRPHDTAIAVQAKGHGPELIRLNIRAGLPPMEFTLGPPRTIQGRVVDRDNKPLPVIQVAVVFWRSRQTLDWKAETGPDGRFRWENAPREEVWLNAYGNGFIAVQNHVVPAAEAETVIKLARTLRVTGTVVDFRTRKPIASFTLTPGTELPDGSVTRWDKSRSRRHVGGRYEIRFREPEQDGHLLKIEAEGHTPGISRRIADDEGDAEIDFELIPVGRSLE
jgi:RNA polymerase sigma factor (sigma-70 family)